MTRVSLTKAELEYRRYRENEETNRVFIIMFYVMIMLVLVCGTWILIKRMAVCP